MDILLGKADHFLGGVMSLNILLIIVIAFYFIQTKNKIRSMRKKKISQSDLEFANLNIQNYRFVFISLLSLVIGSFLMIFEWFGNYDYLYSSTSHNLNEFVIRMLLIVSISLFNTALSALLYFINKISIFKIERDHSKMSSHPPVN